MTLEGGAVKKLDLFDNGLTGTLPKEIGDFTNIELLDLSFNHLSGSVPPEIAALQTLKKLFIGNNEFTGTIPKALMDMPTLEMMNLGGNRLTGRLPEVINLPKLKILAFLNNALTGSIPHSYATLTNIESIHLEANHLSGTLPDLSGLTKLYNLEIEDNDYTFADLKPQIGWLARIVNDPRINKDSALGHYAPQKEISEPHTVYYSDTPSITPSLAEHTGDSYTWYKKGVKIEGATSRVLSLSAAPEAGDFYQYEVKNPDVSLDEENYGGTIYLILKSPKIYLESNHIPVVDNPTPTRFVTEAERYSYHSTIHDADSADTLSVTTGTLPSWLTLTSDSSGFTLAGTADNGTAGDYPIHIEVNDTKQHLFIDYTLHVNPASASLPDDIHVNKGLYSHTQTKSSITGVPNLSIINDDVILTSICKDDKKAFAQLDSAGALSTGYEVCSTKKRTQTLSTPYPTDAHARIQSGSIEIELPLSQDITIGAH